MSSQIAPRHAAVPALTTEAATVAGAATAVAEAATAVATLATGFAGIAAAVAEAAVAAADHAFTVTAVADMAGVKDDAVGLARRTHSIADAVTTVTLGLATRVAGAANVGAVADFASGAINRLASVVNTAAAAAAQVAETAHAQDPRVVPVEVVRSETILVKPEPARNPGPAGQVPSGPGLGGPNSDELPFAANTVIGAAGAVIDVTAMAAEKTVRTAAAVTAPARKRARRLLAANEYGAFQLRQIGSPPDGPRR